MSERNRSEGSTASGFQRVDHEDLVAQTRSALSSLPQPHRDVVELMYIHGVSSDECEARLGVSPARLSQLRGEALDLIGERILGREDGAVS